MKLTHNQIKSIIQEEIVDYLLEMNSSTKPSLKENIPAPTSQINDGEYFETWAQLGLSKTQEAEAVKALAKATIEASQMEDKVEEPEMGMAAEAIEYGLNVDRVVELVPEWDSLDEKTKLRMIFQFMIRVQQMIGAIQSGRMVGFGDKETWEPGRRGRGQVFYSPEVMVAMAKLFLKKSFTAAELARTVFGNDVSNVNQRGNHLMDALYKTRILETGKSTGKKSFFTKMGNQGTSQTPGSTSRRQRPPSFNIDDFENLLENSSNPLSNKLRELENTGYTAALEAKLSALDEMIDEANERLTRIDEDEEFNEMMDKNKVNNIRREVKQLEKTREKLQKEYDKVEGKMGNKPNKDKEDIEDKVVGEDSFELNESFKRMQKLANIKG